MNLESLYLKLPIHLQNILCSYEGWRILRSRYNSGFWSSLQDSQRRTYWDQERAIEYRNARLAAFVRHCAHSVPFYKRMFQEHHVDAADFQTLDDLRQLPVLTKAQVQNQQNELRSETVTPRERIMIHTSGTTGGGLRFPTTLSAMHEQWATWWRYRCWHGLQPGTWCGHFGGRSVVPLSQQEPPFWRYNFPGKQILFSAYHMTPSSLEHYLTELRRRRLPWLHGYPSLLVLIANQVLDRRFDLGYEVKWVTTGAENLMEWQAEVIQKAFGVRPRQHYGMAEAVANFSECEMGKLHVDEDFAAVEFIPTDQGLRYRVVGTNFTNPASPLLRYDAQDIVTLGSDNCSCGRPGRVVALIDGRLEDYVVLKNGSKVGRMDHIFKDMVNILEAQIYQQVPGEIKLRVVKRAKYAETDERQLISETVKRVGRETRIEIDYVDALERSRTGKLRFVISDIPDAKMRQASNP